MTAPAIDLSVVEDLDLVPVCEGTCHGERRPRADFWVDHHGCAEEFMCAPCLAHLAAKVAAWVAIYGGVLCPDCPREFTEFRQAVTKVVPLW